jgi:hypothetical protein
MVAAGLAAAPAAIAAPFPPVFQLSSLLPEDGGDGSQGFVVSESPALEAARCAGARCVTVDSPVSILASRSTANNVSDAGDVNGDGIDDFIVGAPRTGPSGNVNAGATYVIFGTPQGFPAVFSVDSLYPTGGGDGSKGFVLTGIDAGDYSGWSVNAAGDVNGDGIDDVIVGARAASPNGHVRAGETYVVFGSREPFEAVLSLSRLWPAGGGNGSKGFVLAGIDANDFSGFAVSGAGDINGDGVDDIIIGAYGGDPNGRTDAGESYVVFGSRSGFPAVFQLSKLFPAGGGNGSRGFVLLGIEPFKKSGVSVSAAGDVNGDGLDDLIVGSPRATALGHPYAGESYIVFGSTRPFPATFALRRLLPNSGGDGSEGFVLDGVYGFDHQGIAVGRAGDVNGDGIDDLIVGADRADRAVQSRVGEAYVVFGSAQGFPPQFALADLSPGSGGDGSKGFVLGGVDGFDLTGCAVSSAGDLNGDGTNDIIVGAYGISDPTGHPYMGGAYVVFGSTEGFPGLIPLSSLYPAGGGDGSAGFVLLGVGPHDFAGRSVSVAGDVNADGIDDVIIGAPYAGPNGQSSQSYVIFGRHTAP